jgi:hypothetical protein
MWTETAGRPSRLWPRLVHMLEFLPAVRPLGPSQSFSAGQGSQQAYVSACAHTRRN